ncbi:MAG: hypothetical protein QOG21_380 [Actinomycetota bacterium]|nr:hypothetical protein [Actinomycetota bacterium]
MRRSLIVVLVVILLAGAGAVVVVRFSGNPAHSGHPGPRVRIAPNSPTTTATPTPSLTPSLTPSPSTTPSGAVVLTYLRGTRIVIRSLGADDEHTVVNLHTADVSASSTSSWLAYVVPKKGSSAGNGDFVRRPELHLLDASSGTDVKVGPGFDPQWKSDGTEVAYLAPSRARTCDAETCGGAVRVMIAAPGVTPRPITGFAHLHLLAWAGSRLLISNDADLEHTTSAATDGSPPVAIPVPPSEVWDVSPDGRTLLTVGQGGVTFTQLVEGRPTRSVRHFDIAAATLGDGSWSTDPNRAAAVVRKRDGSSRMALLSPRRGVLPVPGTEGAMGNVVWDSAAGRFAFVAVDARHRNRLETVLCRMIGDMRASCRPWFSWSLGVALLRLSSP